MIRIGTSYFMNWASAVRYYKDYGYDRNEVDSMIAEGQIHLGKPLLKPGEILEVIEREGRYAIVTRD